jgi:hypothetical protein
MVSIDHIMTEGREGGARQASIPLQFKENLRLKENQEMCQVLIFIF